MYYISYRSYGLSAARISAARAAAGSRATSGDRASGAWRGSRLRLVWGLGLESRQDRGRAGGGGLRRDIGEPSIRCLAEILPPSPAAAGWAKLRIMLARGVSGMVPSGLARAHRRAERGRDGQRGVRLLWMPPVEPVCRSSWRSLGVPSPRRAQRPRRRLNRGSCIAVVPASLSEP